MELYSLPEKIIRDNVHGYIHIPVPIMEEIVDSEIFQRLRRIEQTSGSLRALYPDARHDRFTHSLGVYFLGCKAFDQLYLQYKTGRIPELDGELAKESWWIKHYFIFTLACLLHDCAHAPFSHAFECYYGIGKDTPKSDVLGISLSKLDCAVINEYEKTTDFIDDYAGSGSNSRCDSKEHEKASALLVNRYFRERIIAALNKINTYLDESVRFETNTNDFALMARMIMGCKFGKSSKEHDIQNCFIELLNSDLIDVDGLDYVRRDTLNTGISNWDIDYDRLLGSLSIYKALHVKKENKKSISTRERVVWLKGSRLTYSKSGNDEQSRKETAYISGSSEYMIHNNQDKNNDKAISFNDCDIKHFSQAMVTSGLGEADLTFNECKGDIEVTFLGGCVCVLDGYTGSFDGVILADSIESFVADGSTDLIEYDTTYRLGFASSALSILQNTIDARNTFFKWVYTHPQTVYQSDFLLHYMLKMSIRFLCCRLLAKNETVPENPDDFCRECEYCQAGIDDIEEQEVSFEDDVVDILGLNWLRTRDNQKKGDVSDLTTTFCRSRFNENIIFGMSNDDDLKALFRWVYQTNESLDEKRNIGISKYFGEYFSRPSHKPLWKSKSELDVLTRNSEFEKVFDKFASYYSKYLDIEDLPKSNDCEADDCEEELNKQSQANADTSINTGYYLVNQGEVECVKELLSFFKDYGGDVVIAKVKPNIKYIDYSSVIIYFPNGERARMLDVLSPIDLKNPRCIFPYVYAERIKD